MKKWLVILLVMSPLAAQAQTGIKVGGVEVNTDGSTTVKAGQTSVDVDEDGAEVDAPSAKVKTRKGAKIVRTKETNKGDTVVGKKTIKHKKHKAITCKKNEQLKISGAVFTGAVAIHASGQCEVVVHSSQLNSSKIAIHAAGKARVTLVDCDVSSPSAIVAKGSAQVQVTNSRVNGALKLSDKSEVRAKSSVLNGKLSKGDDASFEDEGDNVINQL